MFHLFTHAFFKALLFLGAGSVIHALHHEQDMRKMGGLAKQLPFTWTMMLIGNLALTGVGIPLLHVGTAGFYSKDNIIDAAFNAGTSVGTYAFWMTLIVAALTSFYSWRQFLMTFHGIYRPAQDKIAHPHGVVPHHNDEHDHAVALSDVHESPIAMLFPLGVLALGALFAGILFEPMFIGDAAHAFWHNALGAIDGHHGNEVPLWVEFAPFFATLGGFAIAYYYYVMHPEIPPVIAARDGFVYRFLYNKWYFDELYDAIFVRPAMALGRFLWKFGDGTIIDGLGPDGISARVLDVTRGSVRLQTGYVYHYALAMLLGVVALATWFIVGSGGVR
jgi:NADH-quinone oxidoreductase subunit L